LLLSKKLDLSVLALAIIDNVILKLMQEETQADTESDDDEQQIYNPLKLPMGWDGKPIPYWLYKLHGLGQVCFLLIVEACCCGLSSVSHHWFLPCISVSFGYLVMKFVLSTFGE
jgi:hypothetical protein